MHQRQRPRRIPLRHLQAGVVSKAGLAAILLGGRVLIACATSPLAFAQEDHPAEPPAGLNAEESAFLQENDAAMTKMMNDMAAKPTGDVDRDFVAMMIPHHQGAIDMAVIELRYGKNEQLRRIAQEIIVDQMQEIAAMKLAIGEPVTDTTPAPTQPQPASSRPRAITISGMQMDMSAGMKRWSQMNMKTWEDILLAGTMLATGSGAWAGKRPARYPPPIFRSAIMTGSTRPSSSRTRSR